VDRYNDKEYDLHCFKLTLTNTGFYSDSYFCYKLSLVELMAYFENVSTVRLSKAAFYYIHKLVMLLTWMYFYFSARM
jgi:hypothetical protein